MVGEADQTRRYSVSLSDTDNALILKLRGHLEAKTGKPHSFADIHRQALIALALNEGVTEPSPQE